MLTSFAAVALLLIVSAFFSSSETAFLSQSRTRLAHLADARVRGAARVQRLLETPRTLLSAILVGNNLANTAATAVATAIAIDLVPGEGQAVLAATLVTTLLLVVAGEVVPKSVALGHAFGLSRMYALPLAFWVRAARPATWLLDHLSAVVVRLAGNPEEGHDALSAAELRTAIRRGAETGTIDEAASSHLLRVLRLHARQVQEVMVARPDIVAVPVTATLRDAARLLALRGFLRLPVYEGSPDEFVGYLHVSDINAAALDGLDRVTIRDVLRPVRYESEHASIAHVLESMRTHAAHLLILVDEFGATTGLVTLEDLIEELIGEVRSESGEEPVRLALSPDARRVVDGAVLLADLSRSLGADLIEAGANTVAGLVLARLGHIPVAGETVDYQGFRFTIVEADERRVARVAVERIPEPPTDPI